MMKNNPRHGFTLLEMLLAIALSGFILMGLMRLYQTIMRQTDFTRRMTSTQRVVWLLAAQLRMDLSAAFVPETLYQEPGDEAKKKEQAALSKEKKEELERERYKNFFLLTTNEQDQGKKIDGKRRYPVTRLSFVTTNPLHVYGEKRPRIVRVVYELERDKKASTNERDVYNLRRKESSDLMDYAGKNPDSSYLVAQGLAGFFVECSLFKADLPEKKPGAGKEEQEISPDERVMAAGWGDKEKMQGFVPHHVTYWLSFLIGATETLSYTDTIVVASYPSKRTSLMEASEQAIVGKDATPVALQQAQQAQLIQQQDALSRLAGAASEAPVGLGGAL
ncbi:prepilin-type N-terminal cleavage/methylation domain-containing protein [bacterium]|nr:prepilin-type N-terminal cleavage/methylation domain-containing protein [bacterium]